MEPHNQQPDAQPQPQPASPEAVQADRPSRLVDFFYRIETYLKIYFLFGSLLGRSDATIIALIISILGLLRQLKLPRFNREYLIKFMQNQFGLNLFYLAMLATQHSVRTYLFYAPLSLHFFLGVVEYLNIKHRDSAFMANYMPLVNTVRDNKRAIYVAKGKLEFLYQILLVCTLPFDLQLILSVVMLGQYLFLKHKISEDFKWTMYDINHSIRSIVGPIPLIGWLYDKICLALSKV